MEVSPAVRNVLIIATKNAVNAMIISGSQMIHDPAHNNLHSAAGWRGIAWSFAWAIGAREAAVWIPKILAWSNS